MQWLANEVGQSGHVFLCDDLRERQLINSVQLEIIQQFVGYVILPGQVNAIIRPIGLRIIIIIVLHYCWCAYSIEATFTRSIGIMDLFIGGSRQKANQTKGQRT